LKQARFSAKGIAGILLMSTMLLAGCSNTPASESDVLGQHSIATWSDQLQPGFPSIRFSAMPTSDGRYSGAAIATYQDGTHATLLTYENQKLATGTNRLNATTKAQPVDLVVTVSSDGKTLKIDNCLRYVLVSVSKMTCTFEAVR